MTSSFLNYTIKIIHVILNQTFFVKSNKTNKKVIMKQFRQFTIFLACFLSLSVFSQEKIANTTENQINIQQRLGYKALNYGVNFNINSWIKSQLYPSLYTSDLSFLQIQNKSIENSFQEYRQIEDIRKDMKGQENKKDIKEVIKDSGIQTPQNVLEEILLRRLIYANESPNQLQEKMNYFWFNHFNILYQKGPVRAFAPDYDKELRIHALGNFKDLLKTSLMHPAMLVYLDNFRSTVEKQKKDGSMQGGINENYARELLELHTMGVGSGYTQKDIQELARILTGFTIVPPNSNQVEKLNLIEGAVVSHGFFFNPRGHDFGDKLFLGKTIKGKGFEEINEVLDLLVNNVHTAKFISTKLATYFVSDKLSEQIISLMSKKFMETKGNIPEVLKVMIYSNEFLSSVNKKNKFKDPYNYILTSFNFCGKCDYSHINMAPILGMMNQLGQPFMGHPAPDGYSLKEADWLSSSQMQTRFNIAKNLNSIILKNSLDLNEVKNTYILLQTQLSKNSLDVIEKKENKEKLSFLLAAPEWMYY